MQKQNLEPHQGLGRIVRMKEVVEATGLTRPTIYDEMEAGRFPKPLRLATRAIGWPEGDIRAWLDSRERVGEDETADELA